MAKTSSTARQRIAQAAAEHGWTKWKPKHPTAVERFFIDEYRRGKRYVRVYFAITEAVVSVTQRTVDGRELSISGTGKAEKIIDVLSSVKPLNARPAPAASGPAA